jgi:hypothetical protein
MQFLSDQYQLNEKSELVEWNYRLAKKILIAEDNIENSW